MMKTRYENYVIDRIYTIYGKNEIDLSWPIELGIVCNEN